jgi:2-haloacid dehalogenase
VVLIDGALQLCETLAGMGEVGIITNGVEAIQNQRIAKSGLRDHISFVATSEACGYAKPDVRFFEYAARMARPFEKQDAIIIGDRLDADILGANRYGIDSCWFNPQRLANESEAVPTYEVSNLPAILHSLG